MTFGETVRQWRVARKKNQRELAAEVGIDFTYLSKLENGRMPAPSESTIRKIAEVLGHADEVDTLLLLADKVPDDVKPIITSSREAPALLRAINGLSDSEVRLLIKRAEQLQRRAATAADADAQTEGNEGKK